MLFFSFSFALLWLFYLFSFLHISSRREDHPSIALAVYLNFPRRLLLPPLCLLFITNPTLALVALIFFPLLIFLSSSLSNPTPVY